MGASSLKDKTTQTKEIDETGIPDIESRPSVSSSSISRKSMISKSPTMLERATSIFKREKEKINFESVFNQF